MPLFLLCFSFKFLHTKWMVDSNERRLKLRDASSPVFWSYMCLCVLVACRAEKHSNLLCVTKRPTLRLHQHTYVYSSYSTCVLEKAVYIRCWCVAPPRWLQKRTRWKPLARQAIYIWSGYLCLDLVETHSTHITELEICGESRLKKSHRAHFKLY